MDVAAGAAGRGVGGRPWMTVIGEPSMALQPWSAACFGVSSRSLVYTLPGHL